MDVSSIKHLTYPKTYLLRAVISAVLLIDAQLKVQPMK